MRDDTKVVRVMARDNDEVDDGWLCDRGRYGFQAIHAVERITQPLVRDGGELRPVSWERALDEAKKALDKAGEKTAALVGGEATNEEGYLVQFLLRNVLGSPHVDSRMGARARPRAGPHRSPVPTSPRGPPTSTSRDAVLVIETELVDEMPILDLRVRKAARRSDGRVVTVTSRPSTLDRAADAALRFAPGAVEATLARARRRAVRRRATSTTSRAAPAPAPTASRRSPNALRGRRRGGRALGRARSRTARAAAMRSRALLALARALEARVERRRRPDRDPDRHERARPARDRLPAEPQGRASRRPTTARHRRGRACPPRSATSSARSCSSRPTRCASRPTAPPGARRSSNANAR